MNARACRTSLLTVVGCAVLALAAPLLASAGTGGSDGSASASPPRCLASNLIVWLPNGKGSGAAGSVYYKLQIYNAGGSCSLKGFPKVSAANLSGVPVGQPAAREPGQKVTTVNLPPGASASFQLRIVNPGNFSPADCHQIGASGLWVRPPGAGGHKVVPFPFQTCKKPIEPVLSVGPVKKG